MAALQTAGNNTGAGATLNVATTLASPITGGSTIVVLVAFETETNVPSVMDAAGNVYTQVGALFTNVADHWAMGFFKFYHAVAPPTLARTITLTVTAGVASKGLFVWEQPSIDNTAVPQVSFNRQVAPGTAADAVVSGNLSPATALPYLQIGLSMSKTGTAGGQPATTGVWNNYGEFWTFAGGTGHCARAVDRDVNSTNPTFAFFTAGVGTDTYYTAQFLVAETFVHNTLLTNCAGKTYGQVINAPLYAHPTGMIITAQERHAAPFGTTNATVRAGGGEVLAYVDGTDYYTSPGAGDAAALYNLSEPAAGQYLWPYPSYGAQSNFAGSLLADVRVGSAWVQHLLDYIAAIKADNKADGVYLDVWGARLFPSTFAPTIWTSWTLTQQNQWTDGIVDMLRRLDAWRRATDPNFLIVANGVFDRGDGYANAFNGELYVDGVELEHSPLNTFHISYAAKPFGAANPAGDLGHRRLLVTAISTSDAQVWLQLQGVTHVCDQTTAQYPHPNVPFTGFNALNDRNLPIPGSGNTTVGAIDLYDNGNGSIKVAWPAFPGTPPASYNVYVNGVLNQNVTTQQATITGLHGASYNGAVLTAPSTYDIKIVAVNSAGVETAASLDRMITVALTSVMLVTPMKRIFPFPNSGLD